MIDSLWRKCGGRIESEDSVEAESLGRQETSVLIQIRGNELEWLWENEGNVMQFHEVSK